MKQRRVLIVRAGALGDTLMTTPLIGALRRNDPEVEIDFLCSGAGAELLASNPHLSRILPLRFRNLPLWLSPEKRRLVKELRSRDYDAAFLLESAPRFRELLKKANVTRVRDFASEGFDPTQHSILTNLRVGGFVGMDAAALEMDLPVTADDLGRAEQMLSGLPRPLVGIHAGYGPKNKKKGQVSRLRGWAPENFAQVAGQLVVEGASIVLTGSAEDAGVCEEIARNLPNGRVRNLAGKTAVGTLAAAIKSLDLLISVDSGAAHMAAAVGTPLVVLWGPGILHQTRPVSATTPISIVQFAVPCAPCYGTPQMKTCERNICMEFITPQRVLSEASAMLARRNALLPVLR